jgi:lauroyl/myristoyl acyltransferase
MGAKGVERIVARTSYRAVRAALVPRLVELTRCAPTPALLALRGPVAAVLRASSLRARVRAAMSAALGPGGFAPRHVDGYFRHLGDLVGLSLATYRRGVLGAGLERFWHHDPTSLGYFREALAGGKGALMVGAHLVGHEIFAGSATAHFPIAVVARKSPDSRYEAIKQRWYQAVGVEVIHSPHKGAEGGGMAEMTGILRALRRNRVLAVTPDLVQKRGTGIAVQLFGRTVDLPPGAFFLAVRTGAPLIPVFFHQERGRYQLWAEPPMTVTAGRDRDSAMADLAQRWASRFEEFVRHHPDMWQFWLDKRWGRWLAAGG